jgi:hypothetical protein
MRSDTLKRHTEVHHTATTITIQATTTIQTVEDGDPMGYVYCFTNECMPGICKVGMTSRSPLDRLEDANQSDTWRPPAPYRLAYAKRVRFPRTIERYLHTMLQADRINPKREFFRRSPEAIMPLFHTVEGTWWEEPEVIYTGVKRHIWRSHSERESREIVTLPPPVVAHSTPADVL